MEWSISRAFSPAIPNKLIRRDACDRFGMHDSSGGASAWRVLRHHGYDRPRSAADPGGITEAGPACSGDLYPARRPNGRAPSDC